MVRCGTFLPKWPRTVERSGERSSIADARPYFINRCALVTDKQQRLIRCFQAVFPGLNESEAARASVSRLAKWDSVATVTLAAAVEEEFGIQLEAQEIEEMNSFQSFLNRLDDR